MICEYVVLGAKVVTAIALILVAWFSFEVLKLKRFHNKLRRLGIPGPEPSIAKCGNYGDLIENPTEDVVAKWFENYGSVVGFYLSNQIHMVTNDLDLLQIIFIDKQSVFNDRQELLFKDIFSQCLLFVSRNRWKHLRKIYNSLLNAYASNSPEVYQKLKNSSHELIDYLKKNAALIEGKLVAQNVDVIELSQSFLLKTFVNLSMPQLKDKCQVDPKTEYIHLQMYPDSWIYSVASKYPFMVPLMQRLQFTLPKLDYQNRFDTMLANEMKEVRKYLRMRRELGSSYSGGQTEKEKLFDEMYANDEKKTYIDCFLFSFIKEYDEGRISYDEMRANLFLIFQGVWDSISYVYNGMIWALGTYQDIQEKLREDVRKNGLESSYFDLFFQECCRALPMVGLSVRRRSTQPLTIKGYNFPAGTVFVYHPMSMGMNPKLFTNPKKFDPERWRKSDELHPCAFKLFGFGARYCPAKKYAINIYKISLMELLLKFKLVTKSPKVLVQAMVDPDLVVPSEKIFVDYELLQ